MRIFLLGLSGVVVDDVLAVLWMDNGPVTMLSTIHQINGDENRIERIRRRPRETSTNATSNGENIEHKEFRLQLVWDLIKEGLEEEEKQHTRSYIDELTNKFEHIQIEPSKRYQYVTSNFELPLERLSPGGHFPEWREARSSCIWCKYLTKKVQKKAERDPPQSQIYCIKCSVALCCNKNRSCFKDYHTQKDDNN
ncbi:uncharacterized protein OCT59_017439 [Rhizophagus irregularis]|uniref:uncharacterized protein n=1 Tax=Rhizophagus irregularis TaxID=588596 RepID=UPI003325CDE5|nr:hypothetical protein OCT59_017439 [Rhizophagus irregularis]